MDRIREVPTIPTYPVSLFSIGSLHKLLNIPICQFFFIIKALKKRCGSQAIGVGFREYLLRNEINKSKGKIYNFFFKRTFKM